MLLIIFVVIAGSRTQSRITYSIWLSSLSSLLILNRSTALYIYLYLVIHYTDISRVMRSDILYDFTQSDLSDYSFKRGFSLNILNTLNLAFFTCHYILETTPQQFKDIFLILAVSLFVAFYCAKMIKTLIYEWTFELFHYFTTSNTGIINNCVYIYRHIYFILVKV